MKLKQKTLSAIAEMICGDGETPFPYRSSSYLSEFFANCELPDRHDGSTRKWWVLSVLERLNGDDASDPRLPSDNIVAVLQELLDSTNFETAEQLAEACAAVTQSLWREGLAVRLHETGVEVYEAAGRATTWDERRGRRTWTAAEAERVEELAAFLDSASEDALTEGIVVPVLSKLGFTRISVSGHKDKQLEYGGDAWMKFKLPTGHYLYFGVQIKKGRIDSAGRSGSGNAAEILAQVRMLLGKEIFDADVSKRVLVDHVYIVTGGEVTKQARNWIGAQLDNESRRHLIFLDRDELIELALRTDVRPPGGI